MAQILVRNLDDGVTERLRERAKANHRSLEAEVRAILEKAGAELDARAAAWEFADAMRRKYAGKITGDSADLIREDRDSR